MKKLCLLIFILFSFNACAEKHYSCLHKETGTGVIFSVSHFNGIQVDHMDFPPKIISSLQKNYKDHLDAKTPGGHYNIQITDQLAQVNYIQDTVLTSIKAPTGKLAEEGTKTFDKLYKGEYQQIVRLHIICPSLVTFSLDLKTHKLTETSTYLEHPRKGTKIYFDTKKRKKSTGHVYPVKREPMTDQEVKKYFSKYSNQPIYQKEYSCESMNTFKGNFTHWIKTLFFP